MPRKESTGENLSITVRYSPQVEHRSLSSVLGIHTVISRKLPSFFAPWKSIGAVLLLVGLRIPPTKYVTLDTRGPLSICELSSTRRGGLPTPGVAHHRASTRLLLMLGGKGCPIWPLLSLGVMHHYAIYICWLVGISDGNRFLQFTDGTLFQ